MANPQDLRELEKDPRLFLYTSLTAGSSHIITATSRLETILKANKIPFQAIDIATDEQHRKLWQRRAGKRKLPGLVKEGFVLGDLEEVEEWNEYGELKDNIGPVPAAGAAMAPKPAATSSITAGAKPAATSSTTTSASTTSTKTGIDTSKMVALPGAAEIKARNAAAAASVLDEAPKPETMTTAPAEKEKSIQTSIRFKGDVEKQSEHLSAPPSAIPSVSVSPDPAAKGKEESAVSEKSKEDAAANVEGSKATVDDVATKSLSTSTKDPAPVDKKSEVKAVDPVATSASTATSIETSNLAATKGPEEVSSKDAAPSTRIVEQLQDAASKLSSSVIGAVGATTTPTKETDKKPADTTTTHTTIVEQVQDAASKLLSTVTEATTTSPASATKTSDKAADTTKASDKAADTTTAHTITEQLQDTASKVITAASEAVKGTPLADVLPSTTSKTSSVAEKTVPDPAATSKAVETGEIDEKSADVKAESGHAKAPQTSTISPSQPIKTTTAGSHQQDTVSNVQPSVSTESTTVNKASKDVESLKTTKDDKESHPAADPSEATKSVGD